LKSNQQTHQEVKRKTSEKKKKWVVLFSPQKCRRRSLKKYDPPKDIPCLKLLLTADIGQNQYEKAICIVVETHRGI
jgi:hypothetical protein